MNNFKMYGIDPAEFGEALAEAMRQDGANEEEITEAVVGVYVDEAMPDDSGNWTLVRWER